MMLGSPSGMYDPPADLNHLFPAVWAGTPGQARVAVVLKVLTRRAKAALVCPQSRPDLQRWIPLSQAREFNTGPAGESLPHLCARFSFPLWLYNEIRAEVLAKAQAQDRVAAGASLAEAAAGVDAAVAAARS